MVARLIIGAAAFAAASLVAQAGAAQSDTRAQTDERSYAVSRERVRELSSEGGCRRIDSDEGRSRPCTPEEERNARAAAASAQAAVAAAQPQIDRALRIADAVRATRD